MNLPNSPIARTNLPVVTPAYTQMVLTLPARIKFSSAVSIQRFTGDIDIDPLCNGWTAINRGTSIVQVNGVPLAPPATPGLSGESFGVSGNIGELYAGRVTCLFDVADTAPALVFVQKIYLP